MRASDDFSLAPEGRYAVSKHADRRRRERSALDRFDVAQGADRRVVVRNGVVVTVLPKSFKRRTSAEGGRHLFMMLYRAGRDLAYAVRLSAFPRDERRYAVNFSRAPEEVRARLSFRSKFDAFMSGEGVDHGSIRFYESAKHAREQPFPSTRSRETQA